MPLGLSSQIFSNTRIVINGMTLRLDPGSTTSYSGSGSTWSDASGNGANITLVNSPAFTAGTTPYFTFNGSQDSTYTTDKSAHAGDGSTNVATYGGGNLLNGRLGQVYCYNRALTSTEVLQNYNATKSTYGL